MEGRLLGLELTFYSISRWNLLQQFSMFFYLSSLSLGRPQPNVRWLINGLTVDDQYEHNSGDVIENRLLWPQVQRNDLNSIFTCQASNTRLVEAKETSFVLDMHCKLFVLCWMLLLWFLYFCRWAANCAEDVCVVVGGLVVIIGFACRRGEWNLGVEIWANLY